jgi:hypothetical protein
MVMNRKLTHQELHEQTLVNNQGKFTVCASCIELNNSIRQYYSVVTVIQLLYMRTPEEVHCPIICGFSKMEGNLGALQCKKYTIFKSPQNIMQNFESTNYIILTIHKTRSRYFNNS